MRRWRDIFSFFCVCDKGFFEIYMFERDINISWELKVIYIQTVIYIYICSRLCEETKQDQINRVRLIPCDKVWKITDTRIQ
jgi:hypothetical protein